MNILPVRILLMFSILILSSCEKDEGVMVDNSRKELSNTVSFGMTLPPEWNHLQTKGGGELAPAVAASTGAVVLRKQLEVGETPTGEKLLMDLVVTDGIEAEYPRMSGDSTGNGQLDGGLSGVLASGNESGNSLEYSSNSPLTRASVAIDENDDLDLGVYSYLMEKNGIEMPEYDASAASQFMVNNFVDISKGYEYTPIKYWPGNAYWLKFFAYRPYITKINVEDNSYLTLEENNGLPKLTYTVPTNINHQVDLQAATTDLVSGDFCNTVNLNFKHLLSAVKFKVGNINAFVQGISLTGVESKGEYSNFDAVGMTAIGDNKGDFLQDLTARDNRFLGFNAVGKKDVQIGNTFYMMPQNFTDENAKLGVKIAFPKALPDGSMSTNSYDISRSLKDFTAEWEANKTYTYTLTTPEEVFVAIEDTVVGHIKKNLVVRNTGLATVFIRAAIVGYWVMDDVTLPGGYAILKEWEPLEGEFNWGSIPPSETQDTYWRIGSDGYYYYMSPLKSGERVSVPLFQSYELTRSGPVAGSELEMIIVGQAIIASDIAQMGTLWDTDVINILKNKPIE